MLEIPTALLHKTSNAPKASAYKHKRTNLRKHNPENNCFKSLYLQMQREKFNLDKLKTWVSDNL